LVSILKQNSAIAQTKVEKGIGKQMKKIIRLRGILLYLIISFAGALLVCLPLWLDKRGLQHPLAVFLLPGMMLTPMIAAMLVTFLFCPEDRKTRFLGLRFGARGWWRYWIFSWLVVPLLAVLAPFVSAALGYYTLDLQNLSGLKALLMMKGQTAVLENVSIHMLLMGQLFSILLAPVLNAVFAFGEEVGWRGYLLTKLLPLGQWPALLISGVAWGLWHAPVIMLGYNYPAHPHFGILLMVLFCIIFGVLFGWTRLATGSIWPAVIGHGALNGSAGAMYLFSKAGEGFDTAHAGITGWTGWILPLALIIVLLLTRRLPVLHPPDSDLDRSANKAEQDMSMDANPESA
jgi:membrane protease YdiL (CAAX protease family)